MNNIKQRNLISVISIVVGLLLVGNIVPASASTTTNKKITFTTTSEMKVIPDEVNLNFTIQGQADTLKAASSILAEKTKALRDLLKADKIANNMLQSYNLSSYPQYATNPDNINSQVITGYIIYQNFSLKLINLTTSGEIISNLTENLGENLTINNTSLAVSSISKYESKLLALASQKAKARATLYMKSFKGNSLKLLSLSENTSTNYLPYQRAAVNDSMSPKLEIDPGMQTISLTITTVWSFK